MTNGILAQDIDRHANGMRAGFVQWAALSQGLFSVYSVLTLLNRRARGKGLVATHSKIQP